MLKTITDAHDAGLIEVEKSDVGVKERIATLEKQVEEHGVNMLTIDENGSAMKGELERIRNNSDEELKGKLNVWEGRMGSQAEDVKQAIRATEDSTADTIAVMESVVASLSKMTGSGQDQQRGAVRTRLRPLWHGLRFMRTRSMEGSITLSKP